MKTKLTLTVERDLIQRAKDIAQAEQTSISSLVEAFLANLDLRNRRSFSEKWRGTFKHSPHGHSGSRSTGARGALRR